MRHTLRLHVSEDDPLDEWDFARAGYLDARQVFGRGWCGLQWQLFTVGLVIGLHKHGYVGRYCYPTLADARAALRGWDGSGDPAAGWIKYKGRGGERAPGVAP